MTPLSVANHNGICPMMPFQICRMLSEISLFLQCFDTVGCVPNMTCNVFGGTLNLALSVCLSGISIAWTTTVEGDQA